MDRLRQAIQETAMVLQHAFDPFDSGGLVLQAAQSVADAPRIWWCDYWGEGNEWPFCITQDASRHEKCRWVRLVDDPTTNSVQNSSSLGVDDSQEGGEE